MNQFLLNPTKPKKLADINKIMHEMRDISKKLLNKQNSIENFKVPGRPAKNKHIKNIETDKFGKNELIPFICNIEREWNLLYRQSTIKNISADKNACVRENKKPISFKKISPKQNKKKIKFISWIVQ